MENATKAIMIAASILIVLVIVGIGFMVLRSGQDTAKTALSKMEQVNGDIKDADIKMYDRMIVSGSEVVNLLSKYQKGSFGIKVITGKDTEGVWYIKTVKDSDSSFELNNTAPDMKETMNETSTKYINPNGKFIGNVLRDKNGSLTGIIFTQQL